MNESRLAGLRKGYENADTLRRMESRVREDLESQARGISIGDPEGRRQALEHLYAERRVGSMSSSINQKVGETVTDQELRDAQFLLSRAARWS